jgi:hypothetical protein
MISERLFSELSYFLFDREPRVHENERCSAAPEGLPGFATRNPLLEASRIAPYVHQIPYLVDEEGQNRILAYRSLEHPDKFNSRVLEVLKTPSGAPRSRCCSLKIGGAPSPSQPLSDFRNLEH